LCFFYFKQNSSLKISVKLGLQARNLKYIRKNKEKATEYKANNKD